MWFGIFGLILFFVGLYLRQNDGDTGAWIMYIALFLGGIYWVWTIFEVIGTSHLKPYQKKFWLILVICVPILGASIFHVMHQAHNKIVT